MRDEAAVHIAFLVHEHAWLRANQARELDARGVAERLMDAGTSIPTRRCSAAPCTFTIKVSPSMTLTTDQEDALIAGMGGLRRVEIGFMSRGLGKPAAGFQARLDVSKSFEVNGLLIPGGALHVANASPGFLNCRVLRRSR